MAADGLMSSGGARPRVVVLDDAEAVARHAADAVATAIDDARRDGRELHVALAGGSTPQRAYELLAAVEGSWAHVHLWLGDERCVPEDHEEANVRMVRESLLAGGRDGEPVLHAVPSPEVPEDAAWLYGREVLEHMPDAVFDIVLLGMGPDGHTCSLFPGHPVLDVREAPVAPVRDSPKPPPERVTLTLPVRAARALHAAAGDGRGQARRARGRARRRPFDPAGAARRRARRGRLRPCRRSAGVVACAPRTGAAPGLAAGSPAPWHDRPPRTTMAGKPPILDHAPQRRVTFPDLVRIHFRWRQALRYDSPATEEERAKLDREYHEALDIFEDEHGKLLNAYWCADVESAVALTAGKPNSGWLRRLLSVAPRFHRVSDWATKDEPDIARALHHCDELSIRAGEVLRGRSRRIAVQLVMTSACHLLSLVDARGENPPQAHRAAVAAELRELAAVGRSYRQSANGRRPARVLRGHGGGDRGARAAVPRGRQRARSRGRQRRDDRRLPRRRARSAPSSA